MTRQVALLRGVNLGKRQVVMSELRALVEAAGCTDVKTLLASGNIVLTAKETGAKLEAKLEKAILDGLALKTDVHVRDAAEMDAILKANPFPRFAEEDPSHLVVVFERAKLGAAHQRAVLAAAKNAPEDVKVVGREVFITYPEGIGRSKLKLPLEGTMRNWNTVTKLAALVRE